MSPPRRLALRLVLCGFVACLGVTCKVYPESLLAPREGSGPPAVQAGTGVGFWSGDNDGCFSARQPTVDLRPPPGDTTEIEPFYLAIDRLWLGSQNLDGATDKEAWKEFGFDLDNTCTASETCDPELAVESCKRKQTNVAPDGKYCRDNNFGRFELYVTEIPEIGKKYGLNDDVFNCGLCYGKYNILIKISGYNGQPNDDSIRVDIYRSPGLESDLPFDCAENTDTRLCWLTDARWKIDRKSMLNPGPGPDLPDATLSDGQAFVRDGYLVARFPEKSLLWFPGKLDNFSVYPLRLTRGLVSARLGKNAEGVWQLEDGVIGGRVLGPDIVWGFRTIGFCEQEKLYPTLLAYVNANLDLASDPNAGPDTACDSISLGVLFRARQATVGDLVDVPDLVECPAPP